MAEENNSFKTTLESLFRGMDGVVSSKTVVGDAIHIGGTIILPLVDVSFGIGAGGILRRQERERNGRYRRKDVTERSNRDPGR